MNGHAPKLHVRRLSRHVSARYARALLRWTMAATVVLAISAATLPLRAVAATPDPSHVSFTLEGCRNNGGLTFPPSGPFVCADSLYTTGNLGKGWNELDLVPFRLVAKATNAAPASQTYAMAIAVDAMQGGIPGFDVLSAPVLNTSLSDKSCAISAGAQTTLTPGVGGAQQSLYRILTITQSSSTTCVFDYYARLAIGSHLFPGSSLHAYLLDQNLSSAGIGNQTVPLPVGLAQELSKDMTASRNTSFIWDVSTSVSPARLDFANTCDTTATRTLPAGVTVSWTKQVAQPAGDIYVVTNVYASNPSSRPITVSVTDVIRSGTTPKDTASATNVTVPANERLLVLTHTAALNPASLPTPPNLNDVATATYSDPGSGVAIPQTTTATASAGVEQNTPPGNPTATVSDTEGISGANLSYSVDAVSPNIGSFAGGYVTGTQTTGPVIWTSPTLSGTPPVTGSATFSKTVSLAPPAATSGALTATSLLTGSDGYSAQDQATTAIVAEGQGAPTSGVSLVTNGANITVQAPYAGLNTITVNSSSNANITIPTFTQGTTDPVVVTVTKQNTALPAHVSLTATAIGGCPAVIDPLMTTTARDTGKPVTDSYNGIAQNESLLQIANGAPGVHLMTIAVNGHSVASLHLHDGEQRSLNLSSAMVPGDNTLSVTSRGKPGGSATLMVMNPSGQN